MRIIEEDQVIDRFVQKGVMYLVLRHGLEVVKETEVRILLRRCKGCGKRTSDKREAKLIDRQDGRCFGCFLKLVPEGHPYWKSTLNKCLVKMPARTHYDPVLGTLKPYPG